MKKLSRKSAKTELKKWKKKYEATSPLYGDFHKRIRLRRIVDGYETLIKSIDRLRWVVDTEFAEGDVFKKERYDDWKDRISKAEDYIAWCKGH
tara:strand:- start:389 stop:667 length:279 start_codon:yes stop_codon:yes gene_type:complete